MAYAEQLDAKRYRRTAALGAFIPLFIFGVGSALQSSFYQVVGESSALDEVDAVPLWARLIANVSVIVVLTLAVWLIPIRPQRRMAWLSAMLGFVVLAAFLRGAVQVTLGIYPFSQYEIVMIGVAIGFTYGVVSLFLGVALAEALERTRRQERATAHQALRASKALDALLAEELRVRRDVAEGLHGTVQQRLVVLSTRLRGAIERLPLDSVVGQAQLHELETIEREIDELREHDVREISQLLYPEGVDLGLAPAMRMMLRRVPSAIRVDAEIDESVVEYDDPAHGRVPQSLRLLAVRVLEEAVSNALRHGHASRIAVAVQMSGERQLSIAVDDNGGGVSKPIELSGLDRLRERLERAGGTLHLGQSKLGGAKLSVTIPLGES